MFLFLHSNPIPPVALLLAQALIRPAIPLEAFGASLILRAVRSTRVAATSTVVGASLRAFLACDDRIAHALFGFLDPGLCSGALTASPLSFDFRGVRWRYYNRLRRFRW